MGTKIGYIKNMQKQLTQIGIDISKEADKIAEVIYIKAKDKRDFYKQVSQYKEWRLFCGYNRHKWFS